MAVPAIVDLSSLLRSRDAAADLLARFSARGDHASLLRAIGMLVGSPSAWLDDASVHAELRAHERGAVVCMFTDHGGIRERALPDVVVDVPLDELARMLQDDPELAAPARQRMRGDVLVLTSTPMGATKPPPTFAIAPDCAVHEKPTVKRRKFELDPEAFRSGARPRHED